jgi:hypothetical protein
MKTRIITSAAVGGTLLLSLSIVPTASAEDVDPFDDGSQYAYAENAGWINAEPGGDAGPGMSIAGSSVSGWLWSDNLGWISLSCTNTDSCDDQAFGVRIAVLDQSLQIFELDGYAWSENAGWISFSCRDSNTCAAVNYRVQLDAQTGMLNGHAWSGNLGWVTLSCAATASCGNVDYGMIVTQGLASDALFANGFETP